MKTKEEILKMTGEELSNYKWSEDLEVKISNSNCSNCSDCSDCSNCSDCRNTRNLKYAICNVELGKEDYEKKIADLKKRSKNVIKN